MVYMYIFPDSAFNIMLCMFLDSAYIMVPPKNSTSIEGGHVKLTCQAEAQPNNITYRWYRDDVDVHLVSGLMSRAGIYADGSLMITRVHQDDTGWYKCQPTNGLGLAPSAQAFLDVTCK